MSKLLGIISILCLLFATAAIESGLFITATVLGIMFCLFARWAAKEEGVWR